MLLFKRMRKGEVLRNENHALKVSDDPAQEYKPIRTQTKLKLPIN
jgi:hypothetical protein